MVPIWRSAPPIRNLGQPARASVSNSTRPRRKGTTYKVGALARCLAAASRVETLAHERPAPTTAIDLESMQPQTSKNIDDESVAVAKVSTSKGFGRRRLGRPTGPPSRRPAAATEPHAQLRCHAARRPSRWATPHRCVRWTRRSRKGPKASRHRRVIRRPDDSPSLGCSEIQVASRAKVLGVG